ncbi:MAG: hypothetical protein AAF216_10470 [Pseudomonadota bacterium]
MAGLEKRQITIVGDGELAGAECPECGEQTLQIDDAADRVSCSNTNCDWDGTDALRFANVREITSAGPAQQTSNEVGGSPPPETKLGISPHISAPETPPFRATTPQPPKSSFGEHLIITALSLVFLFAGLLAAAMSGFANYQAFGSMVDDSMQARVWAWTGVIASVCSFGGFTLVYWHGAAKRFKEAARAAIFALAGAATSLVGTQMYMANTERLRTAGFESASARMPILEAQIADWQAELSGIDPSVRSVSGLEAYIAEVERVGRTNERPYRAALDELGQAQRRDALKTQIETARTDLADLAGAATSSSGSASSPLQSWFFAAMLEVFSSQGTSIGFVALMILSGRRRDDA